jgi:hypothetical protein
VVLTCEEMALRWRVAHAAGQHASIQILEEAIVLGLALDCDITRGAIESTDVEKLRWLHIEQRCPLPQDATLVAAEAKSTDMLRWLQQHGCEFNEHTSYAAARVTNNLPVLQLLVDSGCPLNKYVCNAAVAAGDLEQLQWLHARGAPLDAVTPREIAKGASLPIVNWLLEQEFSEATAEELLKSSSRAHHGASSWLWQH